jgi:hypothetical protein
MIYPSCSKAVSNLIKITLLFLLITSIKSEFKLQDLKQLSDMILNYNKLPSSILKITLKLSLVQFLLWGIDYIKNDQTIYYGSNKQTIDTLESYVKIFEFSENSSVEEKYLKLIYDYLKDILEKKDTIDLDKISEDSTKLLNKTQEYITNNYDKVTEIIKDYNSILPVNTETSSNTSSSTNAAADSKTNSSNNPDKPTPFPFLHITALCVIILIVLLAVWFIFRKNRVERQNLSYMPQSDII